MSARDDYPLRTGVFRGFCDLPTWERMCDEIDQLREQEGPYITKRFQQALDVVSRLRLLADDYERQLDKPALDPGR